MMLSVGLIEQMRSTKFEELGYVVLTFIKWLNTGQDSKLRAKWKNSSFTGKWTWQVWQKRVAFSVLKKYMECKKC